MAVRHVPGMVEKLTKSAPLYLFNDAPPPQPQLYFAEARLVYMACYGTLACPYTPPQYTVFPSPGQVGRWTLHVDYVDPLTDTSDWKLLADQLPGTRMRYTDFETGQSWVWVLTDQMVHTAAPAFRLGVWPD